MVEHAKNHDFSKRWDLWSPGADGRGRDLDEGGQEVDTSNYEINKY